MISVALAYYNGKKYIKEQLDSILMQLEPEDEVIISVDGAEDGSRQLLEEWAAGDGRIRLTKGPGQGVIRNFEHALGLCRGDYIFLSDQDDIWEKNKVKKVLRAFSRSDAMAVLHNASQVDGHGKPNGQPDLFTIRKSNTGILKNFIKNSYVGCCMAFRRELLPLILPIPGYMYMHDYWIGTTAELTGGVALIKEPLIRYRRHGENVTMMHHGSPAAMLKKRWNIIRGLFVLRRRRRLVWNRKKG